MRLLLGVSVGDGGVVVAGNDAHADSGITAESVWDGVGSAVWVVNATFWGIWIHSTHVHLYKNDSDTLYYSDKQPRKKKKQPL